MSKKKKQPPATTSRKLSARAWARVCAMEQQAEWVEFCLHLGHWMNGQKLMQFKARDVVQSLMADMKGVRAPDWWSDNGQRGEVWMAWLSGRTEAGTFPANTVTLQVNTLGAIRLVLDRQEKGMFGRTKWVAEGDWPGQAAVLVRQFIAQVEDKDRHRDDIPF